jgi:phosphate-selective porin OprO/OprP
MRGFGRLVVPCAAAALLGSATLARADGAAPDADEASLEKRVEDGLFGHWSNGIRLSDAGGAFKIKIGGRTQSDWSWFWDNADFQDVSGGQIEAGTEFRRARLHVGGTIHSNVDFMAEYDFAGGVTKFRDVWIGTHVCGLRVQVGGMKEPFGLEETTGDLYTNFMERHAPSEAFAPSDNTGVAVSGAAMDELMTWSVGVFRDADEQGNDLGNSRSGEWNWTGRVTANPWRNATGSQDIHLGLSASRRTPSNETVRYRARPEMHLAPFAVDTGAIDSNQVMLWGAEAGLVAWGGHFEAEYIRSCVDGAHGASDADFHGWAVQGGWFLTGETRAYRKDNGSPGRVSPAQNFDGAGGAGAWELVGRWDTLDLTDSGYDGGDMNVMTVGVNWYLNPNTKVMLDWVRAHVKEAGRLNGLTMRFQIDF